MSATHIPILNYLRNQKQSQLVPRPGVLEGQRCEYFKGSSAINALLRPTYATKSKQPPLNIDSAPQLLTELLSNQYFLQVDREGKTLSLKRTQVFSPESYYVWVYQPKSNTTMLMAIGLLLLILAGAMYPLWPNFMQQGAYYVSMAGMGFVGFLIVISIIRLIVWLFTFVVWGRGLWIFPNLYADVGFFASFVPLYGYELNVGEKKKKKKIRKTE